MALSRTLKHTKRQSTRDNIRCRSLLPTVLTLTNATATPSIYSSDCEAGRSVVHSIAGSELAQARGVVISGLNIRGRKGEADAQVRQLLHSSGCEQ